MKKRTPGGSCSVRNGAESPPSSTQPKKLTNYLLGAYLLRLQSMRGRVVKRGLTSPQDYLKFLPLYGGRTPPPTPEVGPLDLSAKRPHQAPPPSNNKPNLNKNPVEKEPPITSWKPMAPPRRPGQTVAGKNGDKLEWFPVVRKDSPEKKIKFFPLPKRAYEERKFLWMNPLNRIFLQEKTAPPEGDDNNDVGKSEQPPPAAPSSPERKPLESNLNPGSSFKESAASTPPPTLKSSSMSSNPFKITPCNSWPIDNPEHPSKPILAPPKFGFGKVGPGTSVSNLKGPLPPVSIPALSSESKTPFRLKPSVLGRGPAGPGSSPTAFGTKRPATKVQADEAAVDSTVSGDSELISDAKRVRTSPPLEGAAKDTSVSPRLRVSDGGGCAVSSSNSPSDRRASPSSTTSSTNTPPHTVPTFVPLTSASLETTSTEDSPSRVNGVGATSPTLSSKVGNAGFIFGQNLEHRVSGVSSSSGASAMTFSNGETHPSSPSSGQNLFTAAVSNLATPSSTSEGGKSLSETSREFSLKEESLKTKYEEVQIVTGEEGEKNVIQMNCKLYGWNNGAWQERGRGILRLNDREIRDELHSRIVIRTQGTLTVMLNAKIWAEMSIDKSNDKTVIFTASDADGQPKIYLVMGSPKDITLLHNSLEYRVAAARSQTLDEKERERDAEQDGDHLLSLPV